MGVKMLYSDLHEGQEAVVALMDGRVLCACIRRDDVNFFDIELLDGTLGFIDRIDNTLTLQEAGGYSEALPIATLDYAKRNRRVKKVSVDKRDRVVKIVDLRGYAIGTGVFLVVFIVALLLNPGLEWFIEDVVREFSYFVELLPTYIDMFLLKVIMFLAKFLSC